MHQSHAEVPTLSAKTLPLSRSRSLKRDIVGTHPIFVCCSLVDVRDGFARDCAHRHPAPNFFVDFRRFPQSQESCRGGETRPMRGGGWCTGDRLASQVRRSGFERAMHDRPLSVVGSAERRIPGWIPRSPGISRFKTSRVAAAEPRSPRSPWRATTSPSTCSRSVSHCRASAITSS